MWLPINGIWIGRNRGENLAAYWAAHSAQFNMVVEGHSFVSTTSSMYQYLPYSLNISGSVFNEAVPGDYIGDVIARAAATDAKLVSEIKPIQNLLVLWVGFPGNNVGDGATDYALLKPYITARLAAGWRVVTFTATPCLLGGRGVQYETVERPTFNNLLKTDIVNSKYHVIDTDLIPELTDSTNLRYYLDGIHPSLGGAALVMDAFMALMESIYTSNVLPAFSIPALNTISYDHTLGITKDINDHVSKWQDELLQAAYDLTVTGTPHYTADGILFDGVGDAMQTAAIASLDQPTTIYLVVKQITWNIASALFDGIDNNRGKLYQSSVTPALRIYAGAAETSDYTYLPLNTWGIIRILFNGASSYIRINNENIVSANVGANNLGGITLGAAGSLGGAFANCQYKKVVVRDVADSGATDYNIYNYLRKRYVL